MFHNKTRYIGILMFLAVLTAALSMTPAWAESIKERMHARLSVIVDLKAMGVVGENNQGYLELLKGQTEKKEVVAAENKDRKMIYEKIARQANTDVKLVGQRRAAQIAEKATAGEWLQDAAGKWYKK